MKEIKDIDWNIVNAALWAQIILGYILPFKTVDQFRFEVGFPITFITVYDTAIGRSPLSSMHFNPLGFVANGIVLYCVILAIIKGYERWNAFLVEKRNGLGRK